MLGNILKHDPHKHDFDNAYEALQHIKKRLEDCKTPEDYTSIGEDYKQIDTATDAITQYTEKHVRAKKKLATIQEKIASYQAKLNQEFGIATEETQETPVVETDSQSKEETSKNKKRHVRKTTSERDSSSEQETSRRHHRRSQSQDSKTATVHHHHHHKVDDKLSSVETADGPNTAEHVVISAESTTTSNEVEIPMEPVAASTEQKESPIVVDLSVEQATTDHKEEPAVLETSAQQVAVSVAHNEEPAAIETPVDQTTASAEHKEELVVIDPPEEQPLPSPEHKETSTIVDVVASTENKEESVVVEPLQEQADTTIEHKEASVAVETPIESIVATTGTLDIDIVMIPSDSVLASLVVDPSSEPIVGFTEDAETTKTRDTSVAQNTSPEEENDPEMEFLIRGPSFEEESQNQETAQADVEWNKRERQLSAYAEWLKKLEEKRDELHARYPQDSEDDTSKAYGAACQLVNILNGYAEQYKGQDITLEQFKENSSRVIKDKRQGVLGEHRGIKEILVNLLLAIGTLGVGYAIAAIFKQSITPIKCNTATVNLLNDTEHQLDEVDNSTSMSI